MNIVLQIIAGAFALAGSGVIAWFGYRASTRAAEVTSVAQQAAVDVDDQAQFMRGLLERLATVEEDTKECRDLYDEARRKIIGLENELSQVQRGVAHRDYEIQQLREYVGRLRNYISEQGMDPPPAPYGLDLNPPTPE